MKWGKESIDSFVEEVERIWQLFVLCFCSVPTLNLSNPFRYAWELVIRKLPNRSLSWPMMTPWFQWYAYSWHESKRAAWRCRWLKSKRILCTFYCFESYTATQKKRSLLVCSPKIKFFIDHLHNLWYLWAFYCFESYTATQKREASWSVLQNWNYFIDDLHNL